jgi:hypothetical protein
MHRINYYLLHLLSLGAVPGSLTLAPANHCRRKACCFLEYVSNKSIGLFFIERHIDVSGKIMLCYSYVCTVAGKGHHIFYS